MISQIAILGSLHKEKIKYVAQDRLNPMLPNTMRVPSIHVRLSDVLSRQYPHEASKKIASWALDFVEINLRTVENRTSQSAGPKMKPESRGNDGQLPPPAPAPHPFNMVVDARVKVADPARFGPLKGDVERDVAFNERLGVFAFTIEAEVGSSILDVLAHRLQALSRLAGSIDAIRRSSRDVQCEEITLSKVKFSYTDNARVQGVPRREADRWTASLDLQTDNMALILGPSNPQVRATDLFNKLINSEQGFQSVPWFLSMTLPIHRALDSVAATWEALSTIDQGRVIISVVTLDWFTAEYVLGSAKAVGRRLMLHTRMRSHNDRAEWHIYREEAGPTKHPEDEFQKILQKVWTSDNRTWRRLSNGVVATTSTGAESLLKSIDDAIRPLAMKSPTLLKQTQTKATVSKNVSYNKNTGAANRNRSQPQSQSQSQQQQQQQSGPVIISLDD